MRVDVSACADIGTDGEISKDAALAFLGALPDDGVTQVTVKFVESGWSSQVGPRQICAEWTEER